MALRGRLMCVCVGIAWHRPAASMRAGSFNAKNSTCYPRSVMFGMTAATNSDSFPLQQTHWIYIYIYIYAQGDSKDGLSFVSLYFKIRTSDKCDVNYVWLYLQWSWMLKRRRNARCTPVADSVLMNSRTLKILCCIVTILLSTDAAARLCARRAL